MKRTETTLYDYVFFQSSEAFAYGVACKPAAALSYMPKKPCLTYDEPVRQLKLRLAWIFAENLVMLAKQDVSAP